MTDLSAAQASKLKHKLPSILLESVAIFLSVLLALAAEQWREDRNERTQTAAVIGLLEAELHNNLQELKRVSGTRKTMLEAYRGALDTLLAGGAFPARLPDFKVPDITDVAYNLAADTGVLARIEPGALIAIARAYEALRAVKGNEVFLDNRNAQIRFRDGEQYLSGFVFFANKALTNEPQAMSAIEKALTILAGGHY